MGNQPSLIPNRIINKSASQKPGVENPIKTNIVVALSKKEYCLVAEITPMGMAIITISNKENKLIIRVIGR